LGVPKKSEKKEKFEDMKKLIDKRIVILYEIINRVSAHGINNTFAQNARDCRSNGRK